MNIKAAIILALGFTGAGMMVSGGLTGMKRADRFVTVKGLVEREVKADLALWSLPLRAAANELDDAQAQLDKAQEKLREFLKAQGFTDEEIQAGSLRVMDRKSQEYSNYNGEKEQYRYILTSTVALRTADVEKMYALTQRVQDLTRAGIVLASDGGCGSTPAYSFTRLNDLKPDMLAEATRNARASAEQFAADSGSKVGAIRQANQGVFAITSRDEVNAEGGCTSDDRNKKVRVVTTVDYYLQD